MEGKGKNYSVGRSAHQQYPNFGDRDERGKIKFSKEKDHLKKRGKGGE